MKVNKQYMRNRILSLCKQSKIYANDDLALMAAIWTKEGWDNSDTLYHNLRRVSNPETIRRTRQKLVAEGLIEPSDAIVEKRYEDFKYNQQNLW